MKPWRLWLYEILASIWQYETLTAMTVWNTVSHDSMKHLQPWQYETLNAGTVWSTDSMTILKSWQLWQYETSGVRWVRWALGNIISSLTVGWEIFCLRGFTSTSPSEALVKCVVVWLRFAVPSVCTIMMYVYFLLHMNGIPGYARSCALPLPSSFPFYLRNGQNLNFNIQ